MTYKIKEKREERHLSQEELANQTGISRVTLSRIESGTQPELKVGNLVKIAKALNCDISDLVCL